MVFSEFIFEKVSAEHMYKPQMMKGLADESLRDFNPITFSSAFVTEKREDGAEKEFIDSYLEGAKILMHETYRRQDAKGIAKIYYNYSLVTLYKACN